MNQTQLILDKTHYTKKNKLGHENILVIIYFLPLINFYLAEILDSYNINSLSVYTYAIVYGVSLYSYARIIKNKPFESTLAIFTAAIAFLVTYLVNDKTIAYMFNTSFIKSNLTFFWGLYFPLFLLCFLPINYKRFLMLAYRYSSAVLILNVISFILKIYIQKPEPFNYMTFAYSALVPIFVCFYCSIKNRSYFTLILSIAASVVIVVGGSRGALMTLATFYILYLLLIVKGKTTKGILGKIIVILSLCVIALNVNTIFNVLNNSLALLGYNSRVFSIIGENSFLESSGREIIWNVLINNINVIGHGLYGDRVLAADSYAHNWVLELLVQFGIFGGMFANIIILFVIIMAFMKARKSQNTTFKFIIVCTLAILMVKHMLSASYLTSADFWLFLGLAFNIIRFEFKTSESI